MRNKLTDTEIKAIIDEEIKSSMGEIGGELAEKRSDALDYYTGEAVGRLSQSNPDRSSVVLTTVRDTVEWMLPQLLRLFTQVDSVVEFEPVGPEDEAKAKQETKAINHIFWRQNEGFLILYTWIKDALLQNNGIVKYWLDEDEDRSIEKYNGLTSQALQILLHDRELTPLEQEERDADEFGVPLFDVEFERKTKEKRIKVEVVPPEDFLISSDATHLDIQNHHPRFCGHYFEKTKTELKEMGFSDSDIDEMMKGDERWSKLDEEYFARYNLSDENIFVTGEESETHESLRKIRVVEGFIHLDVNGDGYAELLKIYRSGNFLFYEETDYIGFAAITPNILSHKFFGFSIYDLVKDLQEINSTVIRNVFDNMYQVNNNRPVMDDRVDAESYLTSRPGAPIYVDGHGVSDAIQPYAPPPMWKDGIGVLEYFDGVRKDRTGIGDETMGLDPKTLSNVNTGVLLNAIDSSRSKIELIAHIFAQTGIKWLFRGIHELSRKSFDQPLRYRLSNQYVEVNPTEWRRRTDITVNVGTHAGSKAHQQMALEKIQELQEKMIAGGMYGQTVLPHQIYQTAIDMAENLGLNGEKYFFNPALLLDPKHKKLVGELMPNKGPSDQQVALQSMMQIEALKAQMQAQKTQTETQLKEKELMIKAAESAARINMEKIQQVLKDRQAEAKMQMEKQKEILDAALREREQDLNMKIQKLNGIIDLLVAAMKSPLLVNQLDDKVKSEINKLEFV